MHAILLIGHRVPFLTIAVPGARAFMGTPQAVRADVRATASGLSPPTAVCLLPRVTFGTCGHVSGFADQPSPPNEIDGSDWLSRARTASVISSPGAANTIWSRRTTMVNPRSAATSRIA